MANQDLHVAVSNVYIYIYWKLQRRQESFGVHSSAYAFKKNYKRLTLYYDHDLYKIIDWIKI